jgi:formylmethanofuran dehydrogenase subunit B
MTEFHDVPSPFCGIGTDDLSLSVQGSQISITANGCVITRGGFEQAVGDHTPQIDGQPASLQQAVAAAAQLLNRSRQSVFGACATDVNGMRALMSLADQTGSIVDNINFNAARRNLLAMQDSGWMNCTLAELKNRCDLLLIVGTDLEGFAPRFFERYVWNAEAMHLPDTRQRKVIYLGKAPSGSASTSPSGQAAEVLTCSDADLPEVTAVLTALVRRQRVDAAQVGGLAVAQLQAIADRLRAAQYGVVVWGAAALAFEHAELTVQNICSIVKEINQQGTRCSGFPLGGREGDQTANQVCGWTTGYPARVSFARGYPEYEPFLLDTQTVLNNGEADTLVWVQAFNTQSLPPKTSAPTIVIGRSGMQFEQAPAVYIPIGTPGIDHAGHAYRLDNVVAIRLKKLRDAGLPSTAEVLSAIEHAL